MTWHYRSHREKSLEEGSAFSLSISLNLSILSNVTLRFKKHGQICTLTTTPQKAG